MGEFNDIGCAVLAAVAAELALGALTGHARARALAHLDRCEACGDKDSRLMVTSGELLELLPASEPPPGFEVRVLERLGLAAFGRAIVSQASRVGNLRRRRGHRRREPGRGRPGWMGPGGRPGAGWSRGTELRRPGLARPPGGGADLRL